MQVFRNAVFLAAIVGLLAGLVMSGLQTAFTVPLIIKAETYEGAGHDHGHTHGHVDNGSGQEAVHSHDESAWMPADGAERTFYTVLVNIVTAVGFALLLVAVSEFAGGIGNWRQGILWGFAGFAAFTLAPSLGLPPELPGMPAAELLPRQMWWLATVCATAAGLALVVFGKSPIMAVAGVALIVAPHMVGAPQPVTHETAVPAELHRQFVVAATLTNLVFWMVLGMSTGWLRQRFAAGLSEAQGSLA